MKQRIPTVVAISFGAVTLLGYLVGPGMKVHLIFIRWAAVLGGVALLLGLVNLLLGVHLRRILEQEQDWPYSIFLILSTFTVFVVALVEGQGPGGPMLSWIFESILAPLEAAAASLLVFFLVAAAFRAMRRRPTVPTLVFLLTIILVLLGSIPLPGSLGLAFGQLRDWLVRVFATAGARGMLLGVALATIAAGVRLLAGIDRPHSEREP